MFGKTFKILSALFGQYEITEAEMERIYELTYKYQMLKQELSMGDFGLPQPLEDKAYIEFHRVSQELEHALNETYEAIVDTYDSWINEHLPDNDEFENTAYREIKETLEQYLIEDALEYVMGNDKNAIADFLQKTLDEKFDELDEYDKFKYAGKDYKEYSRYTELEEKRKEDVEYYKTPGDERLDKYEERIKYLDKFSKRMAQMIQRQMPFMEEEWAEPEEEGNIELPTIFDLSYDQLIAFIEEEDLEEEVKDKIMEEHVSEEMVEEHVEGLKDEYFSETALGSVNDMKERYEEDYPKADLDEKILLFQEALTTMHNNGEMAEYILKSKDSIEFLQALSNGKGLESWERDLTKTLGYPPGSRLAPKQEWFSSAMNRMSKVLEILKKSCH